MAAVLFAGGGEGAALALLPPDPDRSGSRSPVRAAALAPVTAAPTPLPAKSAGRHRGGRDYYRETASRRVAPSTGASFMALYREAARTFGVSWRLIASIHRQETAFSAAPSTYHGLNAFGCCAGPMQFNVSNGPPSTWELYRQSFRQGKRPRRYPHRTRKHPSVYDDFDAMMAAGALLRDGGAGESLDGGAWSAAYAYYGHDLFGIDYANEVVARAQGWELYGFCVNCPVDVALVGVLDDVYGADAREQLLAAEEREEQEERDKQRAKRKASRASDERPETDRDAPEPPTATPELPADDAAPPLPETTPTPPAAATEPPAQPTAPPPAAAQCSKLERLLGCGSARE